MSTIWRTFVLCLLIGIVLHILVLFQGLYKFALRPLDNVEVRYGSRTRNLQQFQLLNWCPEFGFPKPNETNSLDLAELTMHQAEDLIFGPVAQGKARQATAQAVSVIPNLISKSDWFTAEGHGPLEDNLYQLKVDIGNYTFMPGGHWKPKNCSPRWKVAIIIPFRNRTYHLPILLRHLIPMLQRQRLEFGVFTINQENDKLFNRAMLMNIGFLESLNFTSWDCFVFHDVDHVPMSDRNYYGCTNMPRHFVSGRGDWNFTAGYKEFFGGVAGFYRRDMQAINGFPNRYWGWGGEDDEIYKRVKKSRLRLAPRLTGADRHIGFYKTIDHHHQSAPENTKRFTMLSNFRYLMKRDGLSNLKYHPPRIEIHPLYINISVDIFELAFSPSLRSLFIKNRQKMAGKV